MPELPEVETIRRKLVPQLVSRQLKSLKLMRQDLRFPIPQTIHNLKGARVSDVKRRSKYLLIYFESGQVLMIHLGMTGRLYFCEKNRPLHKHDHILFDFDQNKHLRFQDPRRFGFVDLETQERLSQNSFISHLSADFSAASFFEKTKKSTSPIKTMIMNAKYVVGVGNIYASEALFLAAIDPQRKANQLSLSQVKKLVSSIQKVLSQSIEMGGTTFRNYVSVDEQPGLHQIQLKVYQRAGEPCVICQKPIQQLRMGGRSTFYCKKCQK